MTMQNASTTTKYRSIARVVPRSPQHWVGDGFYVRSAMMPSGDANLQSPFLLLDHAERRHFAPAAERRGVGEHPHRGFETVTLAYRGEIEHRDSAGGGGVIGPGDVQWMTAASGVVHEEMHSQAFTETGGEMEMVQLWVNLPASQKMSEPRYQALKDAQFPRIPMGAATARLVAGSLKGETGPAKTHTPVVLFDVNFTEDGVCEFELPKGYTTMAFTLEGQVAVGPEDAPAPFGHVVYFEREQDGVVKLKGEKGSHVLILSGEPIREPVAAYGPFVMNTRDQLIAAMHDYQSGKMGHLR